MDISERRVPIRLNNDKNIIINSIVTFTVPGTNNIGLGIVVKTDNTTNTYKVRCIANNEWQNIFPYRPEKIITDKDNNTYDFNHIDITDTRLLYNYDNNYNAHLIADLKRLRTLLDPRTLAKTVKGLQAFKAIPGANEQTKWPYNASTPADHPYVEAQYIPDRGGYSAKSIRRRYKSRRHKKTNRRHKKSNNRHKKSNRRR